MLQQAHQRRLFTVSVQRKRLDLFLPGGPSCPISKLYQHHHLAAADIESTDFQPQLAAAAIVAGPYHTGDQHDQELLQRLRAASKTLFIIYWHVSATEDPGLRWAAFKAGANMVTRCRHAVAAALQQVAAQHCNTTTTSSRAVSVTCDWCVLPGLSPAEYWQHQPLYHIHADNRQGTCQICGKVTSNLASHIHFHHNPNGGGPEDRTGVFALCIIQRPHDGKFLMTQEFAGSGFWVPGGGVNPGESLMQAAVRECWEEAGVPVQLRGILDIESHHGGAWRRIVFWGVPVGPCNHEAPAEQPHSVDAPANDKDGHALRLQQQQQPQQEDEGDGSQQAEQQWACCFPKTLPDYESAGACWVRVEELQSIPLRSAAEPCRWFPAMASGAAASGQLYNSLELPEAWQGVFKGFPVM